MIQLFAAHAFIASSVIGGAGVIHVPQDVPTIQLAIQNSEPFGIVVVAPGTYFEAIHFGGRLLTLQSSNHHDPAVVAATRINASGLGAAVTFSGSEDQRFTRLQGFTITGGTTGIDGHGSPANIRNCVIRNNAGPGIQDMDGTVEGCTIANNSTIGVRDCDGFFRSCLIDSNVSYGVFGSSAEFTDCRITRNSHGVFASHGEYLRCDISENRNIGAQESLADFRQCRVSGNGTYGFVFCYFGIIENSVIAGNGHAVPVGSGLLNSSSAILNCTITGNAGYGISNHGGPIKHAIVWGNGLGEIYGSMTPVQSGTVNPFFTAPGVYDEDLERWIDGDYHLTQDSPYIDTGDQFYLSDPTAPDQDADGNPRVVGARIDIGAYEYQAECTGDDFDGDGITDNCDKDIDDDGVHNVADECDFTPAGTIVAADGRALADVNEDCTVDLADYAVIQSQFAGP